MASSSEKIHRPPPATGEEPELKRAKPSQPPRGVALNAADCNLDFDIGDSGLEGHALHEGGFAYCWSGARATIGITRGKYCFGCKIISEQQVKMEDTAPDQQHLCRIGISRGDDPVGNLGESSHSFGFGGTGKFSTAGKFSDYGEKFGVGDVMLCAVNLEDKPLATIGFYKNGKWLGTAWKFDTGPQGHGVVNPKLASLAWASAFFPHVLLKNVTVEMQFSVEDGLLPLEGFKPWCSAIEDGNAVDGPIFSKAKDCEVVMMVGLPASGKTTWCEKWTQEYPKKRWIVLGTNLALEQMKVPGLLRKKNYGERFERLMERATAIFNTLLSRASRTPRNYVLDQTNVYKSARKRKLREFKDFRKIAVVIFPTPDELKCRAEKRFQEMGKEVPASAVNQMLANYVFPTSKGMPRSDEPFDEVMFPELDRVAAQEALDEMKRVLQDSTLTGRQSTPYSREPSVQSDSAVHHPLSDQSPPVTKNQASRRSRSGSYGASDYSSMPFGSRVSDSRVSLPGVHPDRGRSTYNAREGQDPYGPHGGIHPYSRIPPERSFAESEFRPYGRSVASDAHSINSGGYDVQSHSPGYPPFDRHTPLPGTPPSYNNPRPYGGSSYGSPSPYGASSYHGPSPYGDSRIPRGDFPRREAPYGSHGTPPPPQSGQWQSPRYPSPRSWYR